MVGQATWARSELIGKTIWEAGEAAKRYAEHL